MPNSLDISSRGNGDSDKPILSAETLDFLGGKVFKGQPSEATRRHSLRRLEKSWPKIRNELLASKRKAPNLICPGRRGSHGQKRFNRSALEEFKWWREMPEGHYGNPQAPDLDLATAGQEIGRTEETIRKWLAVEMPQSTNANRAERAVTQVQRFLALHFSRKGRGNIRTLTHAGITHLKSLCGADNGDGTWNTPNGIRKDIGHVARELGTSTRILLGLLADPDFLAGKEIKREQLYSFAAGKRCDTVLMGDANWLQLRIKALLKKKPPAGFHDFAGLLKSWKIAPAREFEAIDCLTCWQENRYLNPLKILRRTKGKPGHLHFRTLRRTKPVPGHLYFKKFFHSRKFGELWNEDYLARGVKELKQQVRKNPEAKAVAEGMAAIGIAGRRLGAVARAAQMVVRPEIKKGGKAVVAKGEPGNRKVYVSIDGRKDIASLIEHGLANGWNLGKLTAEAKAHRIGGKTTIKKALQQRGLKSGRAGFHSPWKLHKDKGELGQPAPVPRDEKGRILPVASSARMAKTMADNEETVPVPAAVKTRPAQEIEEKKKGASKIALAKVIKSDHPELGVRAVAKKVPCSHSLLSQSESYMKFHKLCNKELRKGTKSKDGNVEASDEEKDEEEEEKE